MKRLLVVLSVALFVFAFVACSSKELPEGFGEKESSESVPEESSSEKKVLDGRIGDTLHTMFFDFSVDSAEFVEEMNGYTATEGNVLLDTVITIKNTYGEELPMSTWDFQAQWEDEAEDAYSYQPEELTGENIMPAEYTLKRGETVTYHVVFEVPQGSTQLSVSTMEYYNEDGTDKEGDSYFVYFELES